MPFDAVLRTALAVLLLGTAACTSIDSRQVIEFDRTQALPATASYYLEEKAGSGAFKSKFFNDRITSPMSVVRASYADGRPMGTVKLLMSTIGQYNRRPMVLSTMVDLPASLSIIAARNDIQYVHLSSCGAPGQGASLDAATIPDLLQMARTGVVGRSLSRLALSRPCATYQNTVLGLLDGGATLLLPPLGKTVDFMKKSCGFGTDAEKLDTPEAEGRYKQCVTRYVAEALNLFAPETGTFKRLGSLGQLNSAYAGLDLESEAAFSMHGVDQVLRRLEDLKVDIDEKWVFGFGNAKP